MSIQLNQQYIIISLKNLQEPSINELIEEQNLNVHKFRIEDDVNKCKEVLSVGLYWADYCYYEFFKKIR